MAQIKAKGNSMMPTISDNNIIEIEFTKNIKKYNIVAFKYQNHTVLHRIIKIKKNGIITQGDNVPFTESISKKNIIGIMTKNITTNKKPTRNLLIVKIYKFKNKMLKYLGANKYLTKTIFLKNN